MEAGSGNLALLHCSCLHACLAAVRKFFRRSAYSTCITINRGVWRHSHRSIRGAVRSVTVNLANKFSQCTFSVTEHYDLFSDLIILRQANGVDCMTSYCTDLTESTEKLLQEKLNAITPTWN